MDRVAKMFRNNRKFKGVLCVHKSCSTIDDLLTLIHSDKIQDYDGSLEAYNYKRKDSFPDPGKITYSQIHHFQFLSNKQYFLTEAFDNEEINAIRKGSYYKYNFYAMEMPQNFGGIFIAAPYWEIISEIDQLIADHTKGRMLYCYAASEEVITRIKVVNMEGHLNLCSGSFHIGGASKIRNIQLGGANILNADDFSFIFDNPGKYVSTEVTLRYTKGIRIRTSLICETTGRFYFYHPKWSINLEYIHKIVEYLVENSLLRMTEIKPFEKIPWSQSYEAR